MIQKDRVPQIHASIKTVAFRGIDTIPVELQVHVANGLPAMAIVRLADKAVAESREQVRTALASIELALPLKRIAIKLAPTDVVKEGAHYDLPIALGLLVAIGTVLADAVDGAFVLGELSLHGGIEPVLGVLSAAMAAVGAGMDLMSLLNHLRGRQMLAPPGPELLPAAHHAPDMSDLKGQEIARRVLEISAAGQHNLLSVGPPGAGKSMLAARLPGLLPPLFPREALDVTMLHLVAGQRPAGGLIQTRPFHDSHHPASMAALVAVGARVSPDSEGSENNRRPRKVGWH